MRNPKWHRDEIILALDLYFSHNRGSIDKKNPNIIHLSKILRSLPLFPEKPDEEKFRNANGVTKKLSNFLSFDKTYTGIGLKGASKLDRIVFDQFKNNKSGLHEIANEIKKVAADADIKSKIYALQDEEEGLEESVMEGQILYKLHKVRERDSQIVKSKKKQALQLFGKLSCEACIFEFENFYGPLGKGYIECHHKRPLANLKVSERTTLDDLALVCSNCHKMLHRQLDILSIENLRMLIKYERI